MRNQINQILAVLVVCLSPYDAFGETFGYTTAGVNKHSLGANTKQGSRFTLSDSGNVDSIYFYGKTSGGGMNPRARGVIYADNAGSPGALVATTQEITITSTLQWWAAGFSLAQTLTPDTYWLVVHCKRATDIYGDAGAANQRAFNADAYSNGPEDPFGLATQNDTTLSIYATYTPLPLPIQLAYFNAEVIANSNDVRLTWRTITETNNYGFYVQQSVNNTSSFVDLPNSFTPGQGTTLIPHDYSWTHQDVPQGTFYYRLKQVDLDGTTHFNDALQVIVEGVTGVDNKTVSATFTLAQNYPNPFNPSTQIQFALPNASHAKLEIYNGLGERIATLVDEPRPAGYYSEQFDATGLASGLYFYRVQAGDFVATKKLLLLK